MYLAHFGLSAPPFSVLPDADLLFLSQQHQRALTLLSFGMEAQDGILVLTGEVGVGKTTVIRRFMKTLPQNMVVGALTNPSSHNGPLLHWICQTYDFKPTNQDPLGLYQEFVGFLLKQYGLGKTCLLIIDEAQNMPPAMIEELRMISNVNNEKDRLLQIILVGQPELKETLKRNDLRQFVQRISVHCHLGPLNLEETRHYIHHRITQTGGDADLFDLDACAAVHYFSFGLPRLMNLLCDHGLVYAYAEEQTAITLTTVLDVVRDRQASGLSAFRELPATASNSLPSELAQSIAELRSKVNKAPLARGSALKE